MKIGIIGSGNIGETAAKLFLAAGHEVAIANSRGPESLAKLVKALGPKARAATVAEAAAFGEGVLVAIPLKAYATLPKDSLRGKIVIDAMNYYGGRDGEMDFGGPSSSAFLARQLPGARVVKAFNTMNFRTLAKDGKPSKPRDERLVLFVAGDDAAAKQTVVDLIDQIGFAAVDTGDLSTGGPRQQPGAPVYNKPMMPPEAKKLLGA